MDDIRRAVQDGFLERRGREEPSRLNKTPVLELLREVRMMADDTRRAYLATIGKLPHDRVSLTQRVRRKGKRLRMKEILKMGEDSE